MTNRLFIRCMALSVSMLLTTCTQAQEGQSTARVARPNSGKTISGQPSNLPGLNCNAEAVTPGKITLPIGKSTLLRLPEAVTNRTLGNPSVAQAMLVAPETLYLLGIEIGSTNMILQGKSGKCTAIDVIVTMDPSALQASLKELMPEEPDIRVSAAADSLVLSGTVTDTIAAARANELAMAFVRRPTIVSPNAQQDGMASSMSGQTGAGNSIAMQQMRVLNLLQVTAAQQVMLEVKVAEVSKTLLDKLGVGINGGPTQGSLTYGILSNFLAANVAGSIGVTRASGSGVNLNAEKKDSLVKILAEPNVMAISGQEGSFLAGGRILIPVAQDSLGGFGRITLEEKEFGVGLKFTPTVLAGGRINLHVAPEVSELSREGVGIGAAGTQNTSILPLITTRRASTTVQLMDGQSFAIGGLIKSNATSNVKAFPVLGEIPILGALFRSTDFQQDRTELVFVITPRLVKPLPANYRVPTDAYAEPSRKELFIDGKLEGSEAKKSSQNPPVNNSTGTPSGTASGTTSGKDFTDGFQLK